MPANHILALAAIAPSAVTGIQIRHAWFVAIFLFCGVVVLSNVVHYVVFRVLRRREKESKDGRWSNIQQYLSHPARAIFFITCLLIVLPAVPRVPAAVETLIRQGRADEYFRVGARLGFRVQIA